MESRKKKVLQSIIYPLLKQTTEIGRMNHQDPKVPTCPGQLVQHHLQTHHPPLSFSSWRSILTCPTTQHQCNSGTKHPPLSWIFLPRRGHHWVEARVKLGHHQHCWVEKWELCQHIHSLQGQSDCFWKWLYTASECGHERCWLLFCHCNRGAWNQRLRHHHSQCLRYKLDGTSWLYPVFKHQSSCNQFYNINFFHVSYRDYLWRFAFCSSSLCISRCSICHSNLLHVAVQ